MNLKRLFSLTISLLTVSTMNFSVFSMEENNDQKETEIIDIEATVFSNDEDDNRSVKLSARANGNENLINSKGEEINCIVCLKPISLDNYCMVFGCGSKVFSNNEEIGNVDSLHVIHALCGEMWAKTKPQCPTCKNANQCFYPVGFGKNFGIFPLNIPKFKAKIEIFGPKSFGGIQFGSKSPFITDDLEKINDVKCVICKCSLSDKNERVICGCAKAIQDVMLNLNPPGLNPKEKSKYAAKEYKLCYNHAMCLDCAFSKALEAMKNNQDYIKCPFKGCGNESNPYKYFVLSKGKYTI